MSIKINNLSILEELTLAEEREIVGGRRWGGRRRRNRKITNEAGAEAFATALGRNTDSFAAINADAVQGEGSSSRAEGYSIASNRRLPRF